MCRRGAQEATVQSPTSSEHAPDLFCARSMHNTQPACASEQTQPMPALAPDLHLHPVTSCLAGARHDCEARREDGHGFPGGSACAVGMLAPCHSCLGRLEVDKCISRQACRGLAAGSAARLPLPAESPLNLLLAAAGMGQCCELTHWDSTLSLRTCLLHVDPCLPPPLSPGGD